MIRRYVKRRPFAKRNKYSVEQTSFSLILPNLVADEDQNQLSKQTSINIVPPTEVQGMRKVKNITISLCSADNQSTDRSFFYALVYVPQGYNVGILRTPRDNQAFNMYEANQFVISCGVVDLSAGPQRIFTRLSRNLNSGDNIYLILKQATSSLPAFPVQGVVTYAITLQ